MRREARDVPSICAVFPPNIPLHTSRTSSVSCMSTTASSASRSPLPKSWLTSVRGATCYKSEQSQSPTCVHLEQFKQAGRREVKVAVRQLKYGLESRRMAIVHALLSSASALTQSAADDAQRSKLARVTRAVLYVRFGMFPNILVNGKARGMLNQRHMGRSEG